jgi:hypothetical protein
MSRVYLLKITQRINIFRLYEAFKCKSKENRQKIRLLLCITNKLESRLPKEIWEIILKYVPKATLDSFGQLIDYPPGNISTDEFFELFHATLMDENILKRNPLLYTSDDATDAHNQGQLIEYGKARYLLYPGLYVFSYIFPKTHLKCGAGTTNNNVLKIPMRDNLFIGLIQKHSVKINDPFPKIEDFQINGTFVTKMVRIPMYTDYKGTHKPIYFLYFPEVGSLFGDFIEFQSKNNSVVFFNIAFCACSASMKSFFKNKHYKTT